MSLNRSGFSRRQNVIIFPAYLTLTGSEFHRVATATEKALVLKCVFTVGKRSGLELDDRICLGCLAGVSNECRHVGCLDERA